MMEAITFRLPEEEKLRLKAIAAASSATVSDILRMASDKFCNSLEEYWKEVKPETYQKYKEVIENGTLLF